MLKLLGQYKWLILGTVSTVFIFIYFTSDKNDPSYQTATIERGDVREIVSVSGFVEAVESASLGFPVSGRVSEIYINEGEAVFKGDILATLGDSGLAAQRRQLTANLSSAVAARAELQNGQTTENRAVTQSTIDQARAALQQTIATELQKVQNALVSLRSSNLTAYAIDEEETATAPTISGSYTCAEDGTYALTVYRSGTKSGYSYQLSGLESGTFTASTEQPAALGDCGLLIQFVADEKYEYSQWEISIPNTRSSSYLTLKNAYDLASQQATENISAAKNTLALAENTALAENAAPRIEALMQANASVIAAQAAIAEVDAKLSDSSIMAPFDGIITSVDIATGEVARTQPAVHLIGNNAYKITARIPEIDITKVSGGQSAVLVFDANTSHTVSGNITFVSPVATEIDGVGYFETTINLNDSPNWLRAGLNADIDIIVNEKTDVLKLPHRFVTVTPNGAFVQTLVDNEISTTSVAVGLVGNDGYFEITNLESGTVVIAP